MHQVCLLRSLAEPKQTYVGLTDKILSRSPAYSIVNVSVAEVCFFSGGPPPMDR